MLHLDEGLLMALLDGELNGAEQLDAETHLRTCTECATRFAELKVFMLEADGLVADLGEPPAPGAAAAPHDPGVRRSRRVLAPRTLAWAASIVAALGLGFAGSLWWLRSGQVETNYASGAFGTQPSDSFSPSITPAPTAAPPQLALQQEQTSRPAEESAARHMDVTADEIDRPQADSSNRPSNEMAVRPNAAEVGQAANQLRDQDAAGLAAGRADPAPTAASAKATDLARGRDSRSERQLAPAAAAPMTPGSLRREAVSGPVFQRTSMEEAVRQLGGVIRLIDGFTPEEFEVAAADSAQALVRVIYRVGPAETRLFLEQRRADNSFVASDLQKLPQVVEPSSGVNRLSWNDLRGFTLTLAGRFSADSLSHFKTLVK